MALEGLFKIIAQMLGIEGVPGEAIYVTAIFGLALCIASRALLAHSEHKQARRSYEYARSQEVNTKRFEKELHAVEELSRYFMKLRLKTHRLRYCPRGKLDEEIHEWDDLYEDAALALGEGAPVLNLRKLSDGSPTCGVHAKEQPDDERLIDFKAICISLSNLPSLMSGARGGHGGTGEYRSEGCRSSLYLKGVQFLDECVAARREALEQRSSMATVVPDELLVLHVPEDDRYCLAREDRHEPDMSNVADFDRRLGEYYKRFVNCAFCRLRNSDTGQRDARRINRQSARRSTRALWFPYWRKYDRECPHAKKD